MPAALRCVDALADRFGFAVTWREHDWGSDRYRSTGAMMPVNGLEQLADGDAILLGAIGSPDVPDDVTLWGLLIPIRRAFQQYVNLRPVRSLTGVPGPLSDTGGIDLAIVRENVEGEYSEIGGRLYRGLPDEAAVQETVFTRRGVSRVARYAAQLSAERRGDLTSATKSNGIIHTMPFWDEVVAEIVEEVNAADPRTTVHLRKVLVDALAADLVLRPRNYDVLVASNLLGDILSDLASAVVGGIGLAPSANLNPEREYPSMFEPVHGSAPDIAGHGVANPTGQIWAASMMLDHLGEEPASATLLSALEDAIASGTRTRDLRGQASTDDFTAAVLERLDVSTQEVSNA